jgi:heptosyltransferase II
MILYIQTAFLGDLLLSVPTLKRLRELYPGQQIHLLCRKNLGSIIKENGLVDVVHDQFAGTKPTLLEINQTFSKLQFDVLICPHESFRSTFISALIHAQRKIGYKNWLNSLVFSDCVERPMKFPEVLRQMSLLRPLDGQTDSRFADLVEASAPFKVIPAWTVMALPRYQQSLSKSEWKKKFGFAENRKTVCLAPGSVWPTKQWGEEKFSQLAGEIIKSGRQVALVGSPAEMELCQRIEKQIPEVINLAGKTSLTELAEVIATSDYLVSNDSGAMHIASMTGTPSVSVFGPTVLEFGYQPWNDKAVVVENKVLACRPCSSHGGKKCPLGTHECMTSITMREVESRL